MRRKRYWYWLEPREATWRHIGEYNGWTNWDTWHVALMMDNEEPTYNAVRKLVERGGGPEQIRDWALRKVIAPYNKQQIADAQEWNDIPEHDRLDHHYEDLKDKSPQAADIVNSLGFGPDVSDDEPTLMDHELVNWDEIYQHIKSEEEGNAEYEREKAHNEAQGLLWARPGHPEATTRSVDAWMRYHGADPLDPDADFKHMTFVPEAHLNPEDYSGGRAGDYWQEHVAPNQGINKRTWDLGWDAYHQIQNGRATPEQLQTMQAALQARGYPPEQIQSYLQQLWEWDEASNKMNRLQEPPKPAPDPAMDQPGSMTLPEGWG